MSQTDILIPAALLALLTLMVPLVILWQRYQAVRSGAVKVRDFAVGEPKAMPAQFTIANRHFANLFESPVLFYVACLILFAGKVADYVHLCLAWAYFALRLCHTVIHLGYNRVQHRMFMYGLSLLVLVLIWLRILLWLLQASALD